LEKQQYTLTKPEMARYEAVLEKLDNLSK